MIKNVKYILVIGFFVMAGIFVFYLCDKADRDTTGDYVPYVEDSAYSARIDSLSAQIAKRDSLFITLEKQTHENEIIYIEKIRDVKRLAPDSGLRLLPVTIARFDSVLRRRAN